MMFKRGLVLVIVALILLLGSTAVFAQEGGYPWQDHAAPFNFMFNNLIDTHQQSMLAGRDMLQGYIYIQFTGEERDGVPVAVRADCTDPALDCSLGWKFKAIPIRARLVSRGPRVWLVDEKDLPAGPHYVHFQWNGHPKKPCKLELSTEDNPVYYEGYLMQRTAFTTFFWLGGNPDKGPGGPGDSGGSGGHDEGGCSGHEDGTDEGGCSGHVVLAGGPGDVGGHDDGEHGGPGDHGGHLVTPGMDYHANIVTEWDWSNGTGNGGPSGSGGDHDEGGCGGHEGGDTGDHTAAASSKFMISDTAVFSDDRIGAVAAYWNNN
jgi:hypothetical protein